MILSWRGLQVNFLGRWISEPCGAENSISSLCLLEIIRYLIDSAGVTLIFQRKCKCLHPLYTTLLSLIWPLAWCITASPKTSLLLPILFYLLPFPFLFPSLSSLLRESGKLMALCWVLTINQAPISQAHIKLWTNGYTAMRGLVKASLYRLREGTEWSGKLQS